MSTTMVLEKDVKYRGNKIRLPLYFGVGTMGRFGAFMNIPMSELMQLNEKTIRFDQQLRMCFMTVEDGYTYLGEECPYTYQDIVFIMDENPGLVFEIIAYTGESMAQKMGINLDELDSLEEQAAENIGADPEVLKTLNKKAVEKKS